MGSRRVLGNDPFQRGAAERPPAATPAPSPAGDLDSGKTARAEATRSGQPPSKTGSTRKSAERPARKTTPKPGKHAPAKAGPAQRTEPPRGSPPIPGAAPVIPEPPASPRQRSAPIEPAQGRAVTASARPPSPAAPASDRVAGGSEARERTPPPPVPLAASVVPEPAPRVAPPPAAPSPSPPRRAEGATESLRGRLAELDREATAAPPRPSGPPVPALTWTPLPESSAATPAREPSPQLAPDVDARDASAGTSVLLETLRQAPGVLAEAWSAIEAALRAIRAGLGTAGGEQLDIYGRDARLSEAVAPLVDFLYSRWFRVEVEGASNVPAGGALLVANHAGALPLDGPMLHEVLRRERPELPEARWLAEDQVFYAPLLGTLFNRLGAVRASPDSATRLLAEGRPVLIFPEGIQGIGKPFRDRYRLQRFGRGGFVKLSLRTGKPILPVAIMGAEETLPLLGKLPGGALGVPYLPVTGPLPLPAKWRIRIGEPLAVPAGARETDSSVVESMVEATRSTIEHMLRELLGARGGVFLG